MRHQVLAGLLFVWVLVGRADADTVMGGTLNAAFAERVRTVKATTGYPTKELTASGIVMCNPDLSVNYVSLVNGVAMRTAFVLGSKVEKGQVMLDMRSPELSTLQAEMVGVEAELKSALRGLKWAEEMVADKMLSAMELVEAQEKVSQAEATKERIQAELEMFGTIKGRGVFSVLAPMGGYVISKQVTDGTTITAESEPLFTIADLGTVWVVANVYASNIPFVQDGMEAHISCISYPNLVFTGKVDTISQMFDPEDKALKAYIAMDNADLKLKPGMSVDIRFKQTVRLPLISLPTDALIFDNNRHYVIVRRSANHFAVQEVTLFDSTHGTTYLTSGLTDTDEIVIRNQILIYSEIKGI